MRRIQIILELGGLLICVVPIMAFIVSNKFRTWTMGFFDKNKKLREEAREAQESAIARAEAAAEQASLALRTRETQVQQLDAARESRKRIVADLEQSIGNSTQRAQDKEKRAQAEKAKADEIARRNSGASETNQAEWEVANLAYERLHGAAMHEADILIELEEELVRAREQLQISETNLQTACFDRDQQRVAAEQLGQEVERLKLHSDAVRRTEAGLESSGVESLFAPEPSTHPDLLAARAAAQHADSQLRARQTMAGEVESVKREGSKNLAAEKRLAKLMKH